MDYEPIPNLHIIRFLRINLGIPQQSSSYRVYNRVRVQSNRFFCEQNIFEGGKSRERKRGGGGDRAAHTSYIYIC